MYYCRLSVVTIPALGSLFSRVFCNPCFIAVILTTSMILITGSTARPLVVDDTDTLMENQRTNDPMELINRFVFDFNRSMDVRFIKPLAESYRDVLPLYLRNGVSNFLSHWNEPLTFIHDLLQGELSRAWTTLLRFFLNTTLGFAGAYDFSSEYLNLHHHYEDTGQTLGIWGISAGPYLVLPLLGPSNVRDTLGRIVDWLTNPVSCIISLPEMTQIGMTGLSGVVQRERYLDMLADIERTSLDYYASMRTFYWQHRVEELRNGHGDGDGESTTMVLRIPLF